MSMYEFATGPLVWIGVLAFILGSVYRLLTLIGPVKRDKVIVPYMSWRYSARSVLNWLTPYRTRNMRMRPFFTLYSFLFHICLIATPILLAAHVAIWDRTWGIRWWSLPGDLANLMTFVVVAAGFFFLLRRIANPAVRYVTGPGDLGLLAVVLAPFVTGLLAYYQVFDYRTVVTIHGWTGAVWLAAIPFTRISHMIFFPLTRGYMGSEFGFRHARDW
jgi:nitrate reductase gamma subunit